MKRILAGVDGSAESIRAAEKAADLALATGARLDLLYVVPSRLPPGPADYATGWDRSDHVERDYAAAMLREAELRCRRSGVVIETSTASGSVAETLADTAGSRVD